MNRYIKRVWTCWIIIEKWSIKYSNLFATEDINNIVENIPDSELGNNVEHFSSHDNAFSDDFLNWQIRLSIFYVFLITKKNEWKYGFNNNLHKLQELWLAICIYMNNDWTVFISKLNVVWKRVIVAQNIA